MQLSLAEIVDHFETLMNLGWQFFYLEGQAKLFVWDSSSQYLAVVPQNRIIQLLRVDSDSLPSSLKEALEFKTSEHQ
jgi:hypothetical protein